MKGDLEDARLGKPLERLAELAGFEGGRVSGLLNKLAL